MVKTLYMWPTSPGVRVLYDPHAIPLHGVLTTAHIGAGVLGCSLNPSPGAPSWAAEEAESGVRLLTTEAVHMYMCMYMCIYICLHTHACISLSIYIYIGRERERERAKTNDTETPSTALQQFGNLVPKS